jgi:hypothetical protein
MLKNIIDIDKQKIIDLFHNNVRGVNLSLEGANKKHCGKEGHALEKMMGLKPNNKNSPDILGYEMKSASKVITLGDYSASEYIYSKKRDFLNKYNKNDEIKLTRTDFLRYFGNPNEKKHNRYSWSGSCVPKYDDWNNCGQKLLIENNDIIAYYPRISKER